MGNYLNVFLLQITMDPVFWKLNWKGISAKSLVFGVGLTGLLYGLRDGFDFVSVILVFILSLSISFAHLSHL